MAAKVPASLKPIAHYIKIANDNSSRDPVVYYWCLFYAAQNAMLLDKSSPEALHFLTGLLSTLESIKKQLIGNEAITNEVVAQAHLENFALKLFNFADAKEKAGQVDKSVVHAFYTAGHLMDVLSLFGEVDEPFISSKKYAKWKSTQIFSCLRDGTPYVASNQQSEDSPSNVGPQSTVKSHDADDQPALETTSQNNPTFPHSEHGQSLPSNNRQSQPPASKYGFAGFQNMSGGSFTYPPSTVIPSQTPLYSGNVVPTNPSVPEISGLSIDSSKDVEWKPSVKAFDEARKFTKYALSAIDYEDTRAVVDNLRKALALMERS